MKRFPLFLFLYFHIFHWNVHLRGVQSGRSLGIILGNIFVGSMKLYNPNCELK